MTRLHADCRSERFNGVIWLVSRSDKSTKLFRTENAVWYIEPTRQMCTCKFVTNAYISVPPFVSFFVKSVHPTGVVSLPVRFISANERLRMHQVRGGCVCMRRGSFWARSVILVRSPRRPTTDSRHRPYRAAICRASGCGKFRDDSYEEACKSRDILGNGWILAEFVSTLRWPFDHRLRVFASTPITVLKSARILADFSRLRPPRGIGFLDINRRSNEIDPRYRGTCDLSGPRRGCEYIRDAEYIPEATKRLLPVPCNAVHARLFHAR
ncbi:hypothetical protein ALC56_09177 [Trachymyrmex septentrionalis]|uniref:Uncharacterized protein n=1 Tax=Trachymyrmex septentrionalis TaxID=34720 RepID=A0A195F7Q5_9HYME|nr:hypothetical protein ALC56_09177 [Trachymyrmex septentrionalis]